MVNAVVQKWQNYRAVTKLTAFCLKVSLCLGYKVETWILRHLGPFASDISRGNGDWAFSPLFSERHTLRAYDKCGEFMR